MLKSWQGWSQIRTIGPSPKPNRLGFRLRLGGYCMVCMQLWPRRHSRLEISILSTVPYLISSSVRFWHVVARDSWIIYFPIILKWVLSHRYSNVVKTIINIPQITINRLYKPFLYCFNMFLTTWSTSGCEAQQPFHSPALWSKAGTIRALGTRSFGIGLWNWPNGLVEGNIYRKPWFLPSNVINSLGGCWGSCRKLPVIQF